MNFIQTSEAPSAIGPYYQAVVVDGMVHTSGQIALTPEGGDELLSEDVIVQAIRVLKNLEAVLKEAGASMSSVVKTTIFLANMEDFAVVNEVYAEFFKDHKPARSTVAVKTLPLNVKIEIDCIAIATKDYVF